MLSRISFGGIALVVIISFLEMPALAAPVQWSIGAGGNDHWYEVIPTSLSWDDANAAAASMSLAGTPGHLATTTSAAENAFIFSLNPGDAWLGAFQPSGSPEPAGNWQWVTGEPFAYTNWKSGEPNNNYGGLFGNLPNGSPEEAMHFHQGSQWNDIPRDPAIMTPAYVVEFTVPEPSSLALTTLTVLGLLGHRRLGFIG